MRLDRAPKVALAGVAAAAIAGCAAMAGDAAEESRMETKPPFGGPANVDYAAKLWDVLASKQLVGSDSIRTYPYEGTQPHGKVLEYLETTVTVDGHSGVAMVKKNYRGEGDPESVEHRVLEDRMGSLASVTVMFRREAGYDPDHQNWFWVKYQPNGQPATNPKGMKLAGRVAKGADKGCIACHQAAPGNDYTFTHDRFAQ